MPCNSLEHIPKEKFGLSVTHSTGVLQRLSLTGLNVKFKYRKFSLSTTPQVSLSTPVHRFLYLSFQEVEDL